MSSFGVVASSELLLLALAQQRNCVVRMQDAVQLVHSHQPLFFSSAPLPPPTTQYYARMPVSNCKVDAEHT